MMPNNQEDGPLLSTIAILRQKRSRQSLALKIATLAQENAQKACVIFGLPYVQRPGTQTEQESGESFGSPMQNIGTYPNHDNNALRCDLDDFLAFYGNDQFAIGYLWPHMLVLNGMELIRWNNSVQTFLQRLAQDGFHYCFFETEWTARLSFALGWSIFDQKVLVLDVSSTFPAQLDCLPWHGNFVFFLAPSVSSVGFQSEKWLPEALRRKTIEFVFARSEAQDQPLRILWKILQGSLVMPKLT